MGAVTSMSCERFKGGSYDIDDPTWADVEEGLRRLDGNTWWALSLDTDEAKLALEGGLNGHFVVGWSSQSWKEHYLALRPNAEELGELDKIEVGGQVWKTEARNSVDLDTALACVRAFFESGQRADGVVWKRRT